MPKLRSLSRFAPYVLVSRISAPARTYCLVHLEHDLRVAEIQLVIALVDEDAPWHRASSPSPIEEVDVLVGNGLDEVLHVDVRCPLSVGAVPFSVVLPLLRSMSGGSRTTDNG